MSRVISLPGSEKTVRGFAGANLIVCDEAARIDDDLMAALRPMLATVNGSLLMLSTPVANSAASFQALGPKAGADGVASGLRPATPSLDKAFLAEEWREFGPTMRYRRRVRVGVPDPTEALFPSHIIVAAFTDEVRPLWQCRAKTQSRRVHQGKRWKRYHSPKPDGLTRWASISAKRMDFTTALCVLVTSSRRSTTGRSTAKPPARRGRASRSTSMSCTHNACRSACLFTPIRSSMSWRCCTRPPLRDRQVDVVIDESGVGPRSAGD